MINLRRMKKMYLPDDVLMLIKEFSLPRTRIDWRICKRSESKIIETLYTNIHWYMLHDTELPVLTNVYVYGWYRWNQLPGKLGWMN